MAASQIRTINEDQWFDDFKPCPNPEGNSGFCVGDECFLFETYGNDLKRVLAQVKHNQSKVWTYCESENLDKMLIVAGFAKINALGYFITEIAFNEHKDTIVVEVE